MDDLDKIGEDTPFVTEGTSAVPKGAQSEKNLVSGNSVGDDEMTNNSELNIENNYSVIKETSRPPLKPKTYKNSEAQAEDPYETLILPQNLSVSTSPEGIHRPSKPTYAASTYDSVKVTRLGSTDSTKVALEVARPESSATYDTVVLRDTTRSVNGGRNEAILLPFRSHQSHYETVTRQDFIPVSENLTPVNESSDGYEHLIDPRASSKLKESTTPVTTTLQPTTFDRNANTFDTVSPVAAPALPPKTSRRDFYETPPTPRRRLSTAPSSNDSISAISHGTTKSEEKFSSSPPTTARRKGPRTLPKPRR